MKVSSINNSQTNFKAVLPKYYEWAKKDIEQKCPGFSGEVLTQLKMKVCWKDIKPEDALDTIETIKKILPNERSDIGRAIEYIKHFLTNPNE